MIMLVTGCAGFLGMHTALRLLTSGIEVVGIDNLNSYYDVNLKEARLRQLFPFKNFKFHQLDVSSRQEMEAFFEREKPTQVIHLAAQAGVRYSLTNPHAYIDANLQGFMNILEGCRQVQTEHLVYASSSSVYGSNTSLPFDESQNVDHPISLYAATKKANELMAHAYSHLYQLPTTGLRFFTVYGPWGRPDMALFKFTDAILKGRPIDLYNQGQMIRDFTYVDDIIEGIVRVCKKIPVSNASFDSSQPDSGSSSAPYRIFNIGNSNPVPLMDYISVLEELLGVVAKKNFLPMQAGDVPATVANTTALYEWIGFKPNTQVPVGIKHFVDWYRTYYKV